MAVAERIVFQPFIWQGAALRAGAPILCPNVDDARRRVDKIRAGILRVAGAVVVRMQVDEDIGDYGEPEYLEQVGDVPLVEED
ncbi:hypothetical protein [Acetobacter okinawensis]|uniref:Uncharacterized protein n=1 Tax=Acetobacter okinawensis TaxID=1076594 RepID=A0A252BYW6_9PROT|nr:hypothetical protein [Acetobacter okinawensis]OUJ14144.1 hypothetical protein HK26_00705 [Acetobacter okinawensis]